MLTILDSIDAHVSILNVATYKILYMNRKMKESFGDDLQGKICWQCLHHADEPCEHCVYPNCRMDRAIERDDGERGVQSNQ